jgi:hypothetical protein
MIFMIIWLTAAAASPQGQPVKMSDSALTYYGLENMQGEVHSMRGAGDSIVITYRSLSGERVSLNNNIEGLNKFLKTEVADPEMTRKFLEAHFF